jgi:glycine cleavage system H protein
MAGFKFTRDHEWVREEGNGIVTVGITDYAQSQLGDLVFVELPDVGRVLGPGEEAVVIESVKAAGDIKTPLAGTVTEVNTALPDDPSLISQDPLGAGWIFKLLASNPAELSGLMDEAAYAQYVASLD